MDNTGKSPGKGWQRKGTRPWIWFDGQFVRADEPCFTLDDWEDAIQSGLRVSACAYGTQVRMLRPYYELFMAQIEQAGLPVPAHVTESSIGQACTDLLNKNRVFRRADIELQGFLQYRHDGLGILRATTGVAIMAKPREVRFYEDLPRGLLLEVYQGARVALNGLCGIDWLGSPLTWQSQRFASLLGQKSCILINEQNRAAGALGRTLYARIGREVYTPPITEGAIYDPIRDIIPDLVRSCRLGVVREAPMPLSLLHAADTVFLASTAHGIERVLGIKMQRYDSRGTEQLTAALNHLFFPEQLTP